MNKNKLLPKLFCFFIFLLPFTTWQGYYEGPKAFYFLAGSIVLAGFWIHRVLIQRKNINLKLSDYLFLAWLLVLLISSLFGVHPLESIIGGNYRHQGVIFFLALWLIYKTVQLLPTKTINFLHKGMAAVILIEAIIVFIQYGSGRVYFGLPLGTLGEANAVAGFLAIGSYFVFRYMDSIYYAFPVISILITESKSGVLALLPNLFFLIRNINRKVQKLLVFLIISMGIFLVAYSSQKNTNETVENRSLIWRLGIAQVSQKPVFGFGAESGGLVYEAAYRKLHFELNGLVIDRAHNLLIDVAMWSGIVGLVLFSGFLISFYRDLDNNYKRFAFTSFLIYAMFQPLSIVHYLLPLLL